MDVFISSKRIYKLNVLTPSKPTGQLKFQPGQRNAFSAQEKSNAAPEFLDVGDRSLFLPSD